MTVHTALNFDQTAHYVRRRHLEMLNNGKNVNIWVRTHLTDQSVTYLHNLHFPVSEQPCF